MHALPPPVALPFPFDTWHLYRRRRLWRSPREPSAHNASRQLRAYRDAVPLATEPLTTLRSNLVDQYLPGGEDWGPGTWGGGEGAGMRLDTFTGTTTGGKETKDWDEESLRHDVPFLVHLRWIKIKVKINFINWNLIFCHINAFLTFPHNWKTCKSAFVYFPIKRARYRNPRPFTTFYQHKARLALTS